MILKKEISVLPVWVNIQMWATALFWHQRAENAGIRICLHAHVYCNVGGKNTWRKDEGWRQNGRQEGHKRSTSWKREKIIVFVCSIKVSKNIMHTGKKKKHEKHLKGHSVFLSLIMTLNQYGVCIHVSVIRFSIWSRDWRASRPVTLLNWSDSLTF